MEIFQYSRSKSPGTYHEVDTTQRDLKAIVYCPSCGFPINLQNHEISSCGKVVPFVRCNYPGCPFHETIKLEGWTYQNSKHLDQFYH